VFHHGCERIQSPSGPATLEQGRREAVTEGVIGGRDERVVDDPRLLRHAPWTMPVDLIAFTADRRITGTIPLADDRLSDMLNSVPRIVIRGATVTDLVENAIPRTADITLAIGSIVAVVVTGRRGSETRRRRTNLRLARVGLVRFVVTGSLHVPSGSIDPLASNDPAVVLGGRDMLVPLTDVTIAYDLGLGPTTEQHEIVLINRAHATWIDLDDAATIDNDEVDVLEGRERTYHASMIKDFTGAVSD
jgi:hypothetical protein